MKEIMVKEVLTGKIRPEDVIILKEMVDDYLDDNIILDFSEVTNISYSFFSTLLTEMMYTRGRTHVKDHLQVKNLTNQKAFTRILLGTSYC